ncbi:MAG: GNAT family N-acetyltransferase [Bacteroidales bacterium]|nr:GNAT family N-acetyltransferase [Bacteroidales bacterium]
MNEAIISPVDVSLIEAELTPERFLRTSNKGGNEIYIVTAHNAPNTMREIGRLREIAFRLAGGGTGLSCDIDRYDTMEVPCSQLIVWDPDSKLILGGYRFILGRDIRITPDGAPDIATAHLFGFSDKFMSDYLPYTIELGRSFVRPEYQSSRAGAKALYALDNLWDGLGSLTVLNPEIKYLFGKVTMYPSYVAHCRNLILHFLHKYFPDPDGLVYPLRPLVTDSDEAELDAVFDGGDFKSDLRILNAKVREHGVAVPPLVHAYMSLSPTMRMFGTSINDEFGDVEESGILLTIADIFEEKKQRHIDTFRMEECGSENNQ